MTIEIRSLTYSYGATRALDDLNLEIGTGITAILGPNGAGKSTLLRCLATTLTPDHGEIQSLGLDAGRERTQLRRRLGYLPQNPAFYPYFTAFEVVDYVAILKEINDRTTRHREVRRVLAEVDLTAKAKTRTRKLSNGMSRRLAHACALLGEPDLLLLDEPTEGLDPEQRLRFRSTISKIGESRTVVFSTHHSDDVAAVCGRVIVLSHGRVAFDGSPADLAGLAANKVWLTSHLPEGGVYWRTADGFYRVLGEHVPGGEADRPGIEDGYLLLLGQGAVV